MTVVVAKCNEVALVSNVQNVVQPPVAPSLSSNSSYASMSSRERTQTDGLRLQNSKAWNQVRVSVVS